MVKIFDRNIFIMLLSIMVGVIIITYFFADIKARSEEEDKYTTEIGNIQQQETGSTVKMSLFHFDLEQLQI